MKVISRLKIQAEPNYYDVRDFAKQYDKDLDKITQKVFAPLFGKFKGKPSKDLYDRLSGYVYSSVMNNQYQFKTEYEYRNGVTALIEVIYVPLEFRLHIRGEWPFDIIDEKKEFNAFVNDMALMKTFPKSFKDLLKKAIEEMRKFIKEKSPELYEQLGK